jgi:hypothetical protein
MRITKVYTKTGDKGKNSISWRAAGLEGQCPGGGLRGCGRIELVDRPDQGV